MLGKGVHQKLLEVAYFAFHNFEHSIGPAHLFRTSVHLGLQISVICMQSAWHRSLWQSNRLHSKCIDNPKDYIQTGVVISFLHISQSIRHEQSIQMLAWIFLQEAYVQVWDRRNIYNCNIHGGCSVQQSSFHRLKWSCWSMPLTFVRTMHVRV